MKLHTFLFFGKLTTLATTRKARPTFDFHAQGRRISRDAAALILRTVHPQFQAFNRNRRNTVTVVLPVDWSGIQ